MPRCLDAPMPPLFLPEHRNHILDGDHEQPVVALEIDGDAILGIEQYPVVLLDRIVIIVFDLGADGDDPPGESRDLDLVRQVNAALGLLLVLILADQDAAADRLDGFQRLRG